MSTPLPLHLVREIKIRELLPPGLPIKRLEASGVLSLEDHYFVVFDNRTEIARLSHDLQPGEGNGLFGPELQKHFGYEGIAWDASKQRFYLLVEAVKQKQGDYKAEVVEYDREFRYLKHRTLDFSFKTDNTGFESAVHMQRNDHDYLLALCEGNKCKSGRKGEKPGNGRVQVFRKKKSQWEHRVTIKLPQSVMFKDYSAMAIRGPWVAVVSQTNSMLWIGRFDEGDWTWVDDGHIYEFPRTGDGKIQYGNVEGVDWIGENRIVAVSDKRKKKQKDKVIAEKDQSIHLFEFK